MKLGLFFTAIARVVLPPPSQLVKREQTVKVTLELTEKSLAFFKRQAKRESVPYQRMIRGLIDAHAGRYENNPPA